MSMIGLFLEALDEGREYDFIANNYPHMTKFDLRSILIEYIYAAHTMGSDIESDIQDEVRSNLEANEIFGEE